jgi:Protein of unknown function (DUF295)
MIFLNADNSGFCLSATNYSGVKGNCVYFTRWNGKDDYESRMLIIRYELGNYYSEQIGPTGSQTMWIMSIITKLIPEVISNVTS